MPEETNDTTKPEPAAPEVNAIVPPPAPTPTTEPNMEPKKEVTSNPADESLPAVKKAPDAPDPVTVGEPKSAMQPEKQSPLSDKHSTENHKSDSGNELPAEPIQAYSAKPHHEHRNNKKFAAALVVIIAAILIAGTVFIYTSTQDNAQEVTIEPNTTETQDVPVVEPITPATPDSIDQAVQDIDQTLDSLDGDSDFGDDQLSDETLGL